MYLINYIARISSPAASYQVRLSFTFISLGGCYITPLDPTLPPHINSIRPGLLRHVGSPAVFCFVSFEDMIFLDISHVHLVAFVIFSGRVIIQVFGHSRTLWTHHRPYWAHWAIEVALCPRLVTEPGSWPWIFKFYIINEACKPYSLIDIISN